MGSKVGLPRARPFLRVPLCKTFVTKGRLGGIGGTMIIVRVINGNRVIVSLLLTVGNV